MTPRIVNGWLICQYDGHDLCSVEIGVGRKTPEQWTPAFLDWFEGIRVAKIRATESAPHVWLRVNGAATKVR